VHADGGEHATDGEVGIQPDLLGRRVHDDERFAVAPDAKVAPEAGILRGGRNALGAEGEIACQPVGQQFEPGVGNGKAPEARLNAIIMCARVQPSLKSST
jgi:hypothetical protein